VLYRFNLIYIFVQFVTILLYALQFCMFGRALVSWFSPDEDNKLARFLFVVTEPFVYPIRQLLNKFELFSNMPIDMSCMFAFIIIVVCITLLNSTVGMMYA